MANIIAPNKKYTGKSAGVDFLNGIGETSNPLLIKWFKERGYEVILDAAEENLKVPSEEVKNKKKTTKK
ncbi:MAG: hypothetical protein ACLKAO_03840 [Alkaliphilus sp.]